MKLKYFFRFFGVSLAERRQKLRNDLKKSAAAVLK